MPAPSVGIWPLPTELAEQVLSLCHPRDVASFAQICRAAQSLANGSVDQYLWRRLFLLFPFDDPRRTRHGLRKDILFDWKTEVQRRVHAETITRSDRSAPEDLHAALVVMLDVWVTDILESTNVLHSSPFTHQSANQTLACLRSYLALTLDKHDDDEARSRTKAIRTRSRHQVYDLSNYTRDNDWGPFMPETRGVNWFHIECIVNVMALNLADYPSGLRDTRPPRGLEATRAYSAPNATALSPRDWAGVEGKWRRFASFMDQRDLLAFNFFIQGHTGLTHEAWSFEDLHFSETTLSMELKLRLISPDEIPAYYTFDRFPSSEDTNYPTLYFSGSFRGAQTREAMVVGSVCMVESEVVRWRFVSAREGRMRWSSEGVQIGGIASAMGVVGTWFGAHHERGDPIGPFWIWKVPDKE